MRLVQAEPLPAGQLCCGAAEERCLRRSTRSGEARAPPVLRNGGEGYTLDSVAARAKDERTDAFRSYVPVGSPGRGSQLATWRLDARRLALSACGGVLRLDGVLIRASVALLLGGERHQSRVLRTN